MLVSLHLICLDDIEQAMGVGGGGPGYRAGNGGRLGGGGHVLDDMEQVVGVSSQLSVVGLVSVLGLISVCDIDQAGGGGAAGRLFVVVSCLIAERRGCR